VGELVHRAGGARRRDEVAEDVDESLVVEVVDRVFDDRSRAAGAVDRPLELATRPEDVSPVSSVVMTACSMTVGDSNCSCSLGSACMGRCVLAQLILRPVTLKRSSRRRRR
jgi:hypothetical protein